MARMIIYVPLGLLVFAAGFLSGGWYIRGKQRETRRAHDHAIAELLAQQLPTILDARAASIPLPGKDGTFVISVDHAGRLQHIAYAPAP